MYRAVNKESRKEGRGRSKHGHGKPGKAELLGASEAHSQHPEAPQENVRGNQWYEAPEAPPVCRDGGVFQWRAGFCGMQNAPWKVESELKWAS